MLAFVDERRLGDVEGGEDLGGRRLENPSQADSLLGVWDAELRYADGSGKGVEKESPGCVCGRRGELCPGRVSSPADYEDVDLGVLMLNAGVDTDDARDGLKGRGDHRPGGRRPAGVLEGNETDLNEFFDNID
jgi:hypothetical protein